MARPKRLGPYAPLSATYASDDAIIEAGEKAELLWCRGLAFCSGSESDGYITEGQLLRHVGAGMRDAKARANTLVKVGLWERADGGYVIRGWLKWNKSAEEIGRERRRDRERKAATGQEPPPDSDPDRPRNPPGFHTESRPDSAGNAAGIHPEDTRESPRAREQAPAQAYARPIHSTPLHTTEDNHLPASLVETHARDNHDDQDGNGPPGQAEQLLAEHLQIAGKTNRRTTSELGQQISELLRDGYTPDEIRAGLALWRKHSTWPSHLPAQVDRARRAGLAGGWQPATKPANPNPYLEDLRATTPDDDTTAARPNLRVLEAG